MVWDLQVSSLNPCYNGMTMEFLKVKSMNRISRLNPCYNGMTME